MTTLVLDVPNDLYALLVKRAQAEGKDPAQYMQELLARFLTASPGSSEESEKALIAVLLAQNELLARLELPSELSESDVPSPEEVVQMLGTGEGPSLSEILDRQRGPRS